MPATLRLPITLIIVLAVAASASLAQAPPAVPQPPQPGPRPPTREAGKPGTAITAKAAPGAPAGHPSSTEPSPAPRSPRPLRDALRFEATTYQLALPAAKVTELNAAQMAAAAADPTTLLRALSEYGPVRVLYRIDQGVALDSGAQQFEIVRDRPYVTGRSQSPSGEVSSAIGRQRVGAKFQLSGQSPEPGDAGPPELSVIVELEVLGEGDVQVGPDLRAPQFCRIEQRYAGRSALGQPIVLLSCDAAAGLPGDNADAYITLMRLSAAGAPRAATAQP